MYYEHKHCNRHTQPFTHSQARRHTHIFTHTCQGQPLGLLSGPGILHHGRAVGLSRDPPDAHAESRAHEQAKGRSSGGRAQLETALVLGLPVWEAESHVLKLSIQKRCLAGPQRPELHPQDTV